jgi:ABC-type transport system involved in cytochrome bd biosynthesis fused ATPase/permease subunit
VTIVIKEDEKFLDLTGVPVQLKLRSRLGNYLYRRDCYDDFIKDLIATLPRKPCKTIAILGTAGLGKRSLVLVLLIL